MSKKRRERKNTPLLFLLLLLIPLYGGYYNFSTFLAGAVLAGILAVDAGRGRTMRLPVGPEAWCLYALCTCMFLAIPFAVSRGMAFAGALRGFTWVLFLIAAASYSDGERQDILDTAAYEGALLSFYASIDFLYRRFSGAAVLNNRAGGFFQYANTWALFQLACLILLLFHRPRKKYDWPAMAALLCGIFFSGSRGTWLLLLALAAGYALTQLVGSRNAKPFLLGGAALVLAGGFTALLSGGMVLERLEALSLSSSTLNGRLLYWSDGLKMLREHPLGIGRGGWFYLQAAEQTGVYTARHLHNEYLQAALDGGALCGLCLLGLALALLFRRGISTRERTVIFAVCAHAFIDFDLQYTAIVFLLLLCGSGGKTWEIKPRKLGTALLCGALALCFGFFTIVYTLDYKRHPAAYKLFPADLSIAENYLQTCGAGEALPVAERIAGTTDLSLAAWDCKYTAALRDDDLPGMLESKYRYLRLSRYRGQVYEDFTSLLETACRNAGAEEMERYRELAKNVNAQLKEVLESTSPLAYKIREKPDLSFAGEISARLAQVIAGTGEDKKE